VWFDGKLDGGKVDGKFYLVVAYRMFVMGVKVDHQVSRNYAGMVKAMRKAIG